MKPITLTMTAFGPYKQKEVIDFAILGEHRLFSISGNTGAGKTTIFDAICYALYGEASGEERSDPNMLRSHFADDDTYTTVTLTFEMHRKNYYVKRQMAHRKQGNKTATGSAVELYEVLGDKLVPIVDRFHVTDVNRKLEELIGLTKHQFSQIVMLPQGEFRKLLTSETENKEEILRRIFKTDRYKLIREILDRKRKDLKSKIDGKQKERDIYFKTAFGMELRSDSSLQILSQQTNINSFQMIQALEEEKRFFTEQFQKIVQEEEIQLAMLRQQEELFHTAKAINASFEKLKQKEMEFENLIKKRPFIKEEEQRIKLAEEANRLVPYEDSCKEANRIVASTEKAWKEISKKKEYTEVSYKQALSHYEEEKAKQEVREQKKQEWNTLFSMKSIVETLAERKKELQTTSKQVITTRETLREYGQRYEYNVQERNSILSNLQKLDEAAQYYTIKFNELTSLRDDMKLLMKYDKARKQVKQDEVALRDAETSRNKKNVEYEQIEKRWLSEQAGQLAAHLHDGLPCPVCGSTEHPNKADRSLNSVSEHEMNEARSQRENADRAYFNINEKWKVSSSQCQELAAEAKGLGYDLHHFDEEYNQLCEKGKMLSSEVKLLEQNETKRQAMRNKVKDMEQLIEGLLQKIKQLENEFHRLEKKELEQKFSLENDQKTIPDKITSLEEWKVLCQQAKLEADALEQSWMDAEQLYEKLRTELMQVEAECTSRSNELERANVQKTQKYDIFIHQLADAGFTNENMYEAAKLSSEQLQDVKRMVQEYYTSFDVVSKQIDELQKLLLDKKIMDTTELSESVKELQRLVTTLIEQRQSMKRTIEDIEKLIGSIASIDEKIREDEKYYEELVDLFEVIKGDNENRISFERYILIEYLEQIVHAANERLRKLSNGQFFLKRSDRIEKRNRQSGLGLDVYDAYTGQTRDVKTLSGGEKFNASLCLALGMADVIQAYEGGISIETMFIDEGFGSLDEESLLKAIDTLIDLQKSGRLIGVISHVQELKQALPASLEVTKSKDGYSQTKFIIK